MSSMSGKVLDAISSSSTSLKRTLSARSPPFRAIFDQSYAKLLQFQLSFDFSSPSQPDSVQTSNEYRNLLLSLSDNRCDHILWIRELRKLNWRGDGDFSFTLDKGGLPTLKSGEYKLNLCVEFVEMPFHQQHAATKREPIFIWDGNFAGGEEEKTKCDEVEPIEGHCHLSMGAILPMVEKCARMMRQNGQIIKGNTILVYMPCIVQLLVTIFAASRIGASLVYVNASINKDPNDLAEILMLSDAQLIVTIDGFQVVDRNGARKVQKPKEILDEAIQRLETKQNVNNSLKVIVVRHMLSPSALDQQMANKTDRLDSSDAPEKNGKTSSYEAPMKLDRDYFWADLMVEIADGEEKTVSADALNDNDNVQIGIEWMNSEDIVFNAISKIQQNKKKQNGEFGGNQWHFESYTVGQIALLVQLLSAKLSSPTGTQRNDGGPAQEMIAARQRELFRKRQSLHLIQSRSFDERDEEAIDDDEEEEEDDMAALARKGSTRSQPAAVFHSSRKWEERKISQEREEEKHQLIWPLVEAHDLLFVASLFAIAKSQSSIFMSESPLTEENEIFHKIAKFGITQLMIGQGHLNILARNTDSHKIWCGEELHEKSDSHFVDVPSLGLIYSVAKMTPSSLSKEKLIEENENVLKFYCNSNTTTTTATEGANNGGIEGTKTPQICHLLC